MYRPLGLEGGGKNSKAHQQGNGSISDGDQAEEADIQTEVRTEPGVGDGNIFGVYIRAIRLQ